MPPSLETLSGRARGELCAAAVTCGGQTFTPDEDNAYLAFRLSHSLPGVTVMNCGLHPATIAASWPSIVFKQFNFGHLLKAKDPKKQQADRILGTILAAEFPATPEGGWTVPATVADAPGIRAVTCVHRVADGAEDILNLHRDGALEWQVSMEVEHRAETGAFALPTAEGGWRFVAWSQADADLRQCLAPRPGGGTMVAGEYQGVKPVFLWGGVPGLADCAGKVRYQGVGLVYAGAEPANKVESVTAGDPAALGAALAGLLRASAALLR